MIKGMKLPGWVVKYQNLIKALVMMFLPLVCCIVTCALDGKSLGSIYGPSSTWNDELFYYKQVEAILQYGFPQGNFGFNESQALVGGFAAWSPVVLLPWILWGAIFGWNFMSPIYCNVFVMMLAVFLFVYLVRPNFRQCLMLTVLYAAFTPMTRYILSYMSEAFFFAMVVIMLSFVLAYNREEKLWKLIAMTVFGAFMTLMRPYLILFMVFPIWFWFKKNRLWGSVLMVGVLGLTAVFYWAVSHYLTAAYFHPIYDTTFIKTFLNSGIWEGIKFTLHKLLTMGRTVYGMIVEGFRSGYYTGTQFAGFSLLMLILWGQAFVDFRKKKWQQFQIYFPLAVCFLGILTAVILMYQPSQGGRHLLTFGVLGIFVLSVMETKFYRKGILTAAVFAYLFMMMAADAEEQQIPYKAEERVAAVEYWKETLEEKIDLDAENAPSFDNVIIWTVSDKVEGQTKLTNWQELYAAPAGMAISCCYEDYVTENLHGLKSKYVAVPVEGDLDAACKEAGYAELGRSGDVVIYRLR